MPPKKTVSKPVEQSSDDDSQTQTQGNQDVQTGSPGRTEVSTRTTSGTSTQNNEGASTIKTCIKVIENRRNVAHERIKQMLAIVESENVDQVSGSLLKTRLSLVADEWLKFIKSHDEICERATTSVQGQDSTDLYSEVSNLYARCIDVIHGHMKLVKERFAQTEQSVNTDARGLLNSALNLKLEPIKIPIFNGAKENWVLFRDQFISLVHENERMTDAVKMHQLVTHVTDKAIRVIKGITPSGQNYGKAWKVLNDRFNNNQMLINHHLKRFFNLPTLTRDDPSKLIIIVDGVNELINSLPGLNEPMQNWDSIITFCVFNKLDKATQEAWKTRTMVQEARPLHEFMTFLDNRAQIDDTTNSSLLVPSTPRFEPKKLPKKNVFHVVPTTKNSQSNTKKVVHHVLGTDANKKCPECKQEHPLFRCPTFRTIPVKDRITKARHYELCPKCLAKHAVEIKCAFEKCPVCSKPHNRLLCYDDEKRRAEAQTSSSFPQASVNHLFLHGHSTALLATAEVRIANTISDSPNIRCLCDNGSQLNLITDEAVRKLKIPRTNAKVQLNGIGGIVTGKSMGIVKLRVTSLYNDKEFLDATFFIVKQVTLPLPLVRIATGWLSNETRLPMADPNFAIPGPIEALLGVNFWATIIKPEIKKFNDHIVAQNTKLGWVVFGSAEPQLRLRSQKRSYITAVITQEPVDNILNSLTQFWQSEKDIEPMKKFSVRIFSGKVHIARQMEDTEFDFHLARAQLCLVIQKKLLKSNFFPWKKD